MIVRIKSKNNKQLYQDHIRSLLKQHKIQIHFSINPRSLAFRNKKLIKTREIKSSITYAIALHEIGHILSDGSDLSCLEEEAVAWHWAYRNALQWTKSMQKSMKKSLHSYLHQAFFTSSMEIPPKNSLFFRLIKE